MKLRCSDSIDLAKIILSLMVVAIHVPPARGGAYEILIPILRTAVPIFFMLSGYLLFGKIKDCTIEEKKSIVTNYIIRILKLYLSWFVILLPVTIIRGDYFVDGISVGILEILKDFVLGSTFPASWYLMAVVIGTILVFIISALKESCLSDSIVLVCGGILYVLCCLLSNYRNVIGHTPLSISYNIFNSFPVSIIWIELGKLFAEQKKVRLYTTRFRFCGAFICIIFLYIEQFVILHFKWGYTNDCYFMLVPCCIFIFSIIISGKIKIRNAKILRSISTIMYCLHLSIAIIVNKVLIFFGVIETNFILWIKYIFVVAFCFVVAVLILKICNREKMRIVKYLF